MPGYPDDFVAGTGRVAVFAKAASGAWDRVDTLDPADGMAGDRFGERVALDGGSALVASERGVYFFRLVKGSWIQIQKLQATPDAPLNGGVALEEGVAFIGTTRPGQPSAVEVFQSGGNRLLHRVQAITASGGASDDAFGEVLAAHHDDLIVGAPADNEGQGAAYLFERRGHRWVEHQKLIPTDGQAGEAFGAAVAIARNVLAIGAPEADVNSDISQCEFGHSGAVYVFEPRRRFWIEQQKVATPPECARDFAFQVAIDERWLVAATPSFFPGQESLSFVYRRSAAGFAPTGIIFNSDESIPILALARSTLFVGLPVDRFFSTGMVSVFELNQPP
jgi:hypothetical protein